MPSSSLRPRIRLSSVWGALEKFLQNQPVKTPRLLKAALSHVQFETIHPFLDGNGRLGRLLITLLLCAEGALAEPMLYLSLYFKTHRQEYYDLLQGVRANGDWEAWLAFFLTGIIETAEQAVQTVRRLQKLFDEDREKVQKLGRASGSAIRLLSFMQKHPICSIAKASEAMDLSIPTVTAAMKNLIDARITRELTGHRRNRLFAYQKYIHVLSR